MFKLLFRKPNRRIPDDVFESERKILESSQADIVYIKKVIERFEESLSQLNPMHTEFEARIEGFYASDRDSVRQARVNELAHKTETIAAAYAEAKTEYVSAKTSLDKLESELAHLMKRLADRDLAYWKEVHYGKKVEKLRKSRSLLGSEKMLRNLKKLGRASDGFKEVDAPVIEECKAWIDGRFEKMEGVLATYTKHIETYYSGVHTKLAAAPPTSPSSTVHSPSILARLMGTSNPAKEAPEKNTVQEEEDGIPPFLM